MLLDGRDLRTLNLRWLRRQLGLVSQEPILFATRYLPHHHHLPPCLYPPPLLGVAGADPLWWNGITLILFGGAGAMSSIAENIRYGIEG